MTQRERLERAWAALTQRGAVVRRVDTEWLSDREIGVLAEAAEHRLRVLREGIDAGWFPKEAS